MCLGVCASESTREQKQKRGRLREYVCVYARESSDTREREEAMGKETAREGRENTKTRNMKQESA